MIETFLTENDKAIWIDVQPPTPEELERISQVYQLPDEAIHDCVDAKHLPKFEQLEGVTFVIVRTFDPTCKNDTHTYTGLTRKLAIFLGNRFLVTVHRSDQPILRVVRDRHLADKDPSHLQVIMLELLLEAVGTYHRPLEAMELVINKYESALLRRGEEWLNWEEVFRTKCRLMVTKRMLWHLLNSVQKFMPYSTSNLTQRQDLLERIENLQFFADSLLDDLTNLLSVQLALLSNRANQVMKVLTVFSAFFLPLTFIVGVYGMNFRYMPEIEWRHGYLFVWAVLLATVGGVYILFRKMGLFGTKKRRPGP